jgi:hypothetical protein
VLVFFSTLFSMSLYVSMPLFASMRFSTFLCSKPFPIVVCNLLGFYVGLLFYSNVVLSASLCFSDLFCFKQSFYLSIQ